MRRPSPSGRCGRPPSPSRRNRNTRSCRLTTLPVVPRLAVLREVQAHDLLFFGNAKAHRLVEDLEQDPGHDEGVHRGYAGRPRLHDEKLGIPEEEPVPTAGVMATSPATAPEAAPRTVGLPRCTHSANIQESIAADAAIWVTTNALVERPPAARALPALNPNQPNQRIPAPKTVIGRLWGAMFSR